MNRYNFPRRTSRFGKVGAGLIVIAIGTVLLLKQLGYFFPAWFLSWPILLIALGLFIGFKSNFRHFGWLFPVFIGSLFLARNFFPAFEAHRFIWPVVIILLGLIIIFKKQRHTWAGFPECLPNDADRPIPPAPITPPPSYASPISGSRPIRKLRASAPAQ